MNTRYALVVGVILAVGSCGAPTMSLAGTINGNGRNLTNLPGLLNVADFGARRDYKTDDAPAIQAAINRATAHPWSYRGIYLPEGDYLLKTPIKMTNNAGFHLSGSSKTGTRLLSVITNDHVIEFFGCQYSLIENFFIQQNAENGTNALIMIRGAEGRNVQGNNFRNLYLAGGGKLDYGLRLNQNAGSSGMGSENLWENIHISGCRFAGASLNGWNALQNTIIGGNISGCGHFGLYLDGATVHAYSVGFQNGYYNSNDVYVVNYSSDKNTFFHCRSESLHGPNLGSGPATVDGWVATPGPPLWQPNYAYTNGQVVMPTSLFGSITAMGCLWRCVAAGMSGSTEPAWPTHSGMVTNDGTAAWHSIDDPVLSMQKGSMRDCNINYGRVFIGNAGVTLLNNNFSRADFMDATNYFYSLPLLVGNTVGFGTASFATTVGGAWGVTNESHLFLGRTPLVWSRDYPPTSFRYPQTGFGVNQYLPLNSATGYVAYAGPVILSGALSRMANVAADGPGLDLDFAGGPGRGAGKAGSVNFWFHGTNSGGNPFAQVEPEKRVVMNYDSTTLNHRLQVNGSVTVSNTATATGYFINTNAAPPAAPSAGGQAFMWNSNGVLYLLTSLPGSAAWVATNKLAP